MQSTRLPVALALLPLFLAACDSAGSTLDSGLDASTPDASRGDGGADAASIDSATPADATPGDGMAGDAARPTVDDVSAVLCPAIARIRCSTPYACACPGFGEPPDPDACRSAEASDCRAVFGDSTRGRRVAAGELEVDLARLASCLDHLEASYARCTGSIVDLEELCAPAFVELDVAIGGTCAPGARCAEGAGTCATGTCEMLPGLGAACEGMCASTLVCVSGTCAMPGEAGDPCESDADCALAFACAGGECRTLAASDGSCDDDADCALGHRCGKGTCFADPGATCVDDDACAALERCGAETFEGRCRAREARGATCSSPEACDDGRCDSGSGTCVAPLGAGEPCGDRSDCAAGLVCSFAGTCEAPGAAGEPCVSGFGVSGCAAGLGCTEDVCRPLGVAGEPCDGFGSCAPGFACRVESDGVRCGAPRALGETCASDAECGDTGRCDASGSGTCIARAGLDEGCIFDAQCEVGLLCALDEEAFVFRCRPPAPLGERCVRSELCADGAYCRSEPAVRSCAPRVCDELFLFPPEDI